MHKKHETEETRNGRNQEELRLRLHAMPNARQIYHNWNTDDYYNVYTAHGGKASEYIKSGKCERACPGIWRFAGCRRRWRRNSRRKKPDGPPELTHSSLTFRGKTGKV